MKKLLAILFAVLTLAVAVPADRPADGAGLSPCGGGGAWALPLSGHLPGPGGLCGEDRRCLRCGQVLAEDLGHDYQYQYDAVRDGDGRFASFGTWRCRRCGRVLAATEANAVYYYAPPVYEARADGPDPAAPSPRTGLWRAVCIAAAAGLAGETVLLLRGLRRERWGR